MDVSNFLKIDAVDQPDSACFSLGAEQEIYAKKKKIIAPNIELWIEVIKDLSKLLFYLTGNKKSWLDSSQM